MAKYNIVIPYDVIPHKEREFYESHGFEFKESDIGLVPINPSIEKEFRSYKSLVTYVKSVPMALIIYPNIFIYPDEQVRFRWVPGVRVNEK